MGGIAAPINRLSCRKRDKNLRFATFPQLARGIVAGRAKETIAFQGIALCECAFHVGAFLLREEKIALHDGINE
jgi:hypothetical protein